MSSTTPGSKGLLIINLGTPKEPTPKAVGEYLSEFLNDGFVIGAPRPLRKILVDGLIVPRRKFKSAALYQKIWLKEGSPLMVHSMQFLEKLRKTLAGDEIQVELAMRYGVPSIADALEKLRSGGVTELQVIPLYPHYAESSTRTSLEKVNELLAKMNWQPTLKMRKDFYNDKGFIQAWKNIFTPYFYSVCSFRYWRAVTLRFRPTRVDCGTISTQMCQRQVTSRWMLNL